jgi:hypothetical protein
VPLGQHESAAQEAFSVLAGPLREDHGMLSRRIAVCLEVTPEQAVASALDWPGWRRAGRDERAALEALTGYAGRYPPVAGQARVSFAVAVDVVERLPGGPATAFWVPADADMASRTWP